VHHQELPSIELLVLEALCERQRGFGAIDLPGVCPELVAVTVCRLMRKGLVDATPDGIPVGVTSAGLDWMCSYGRA
jgi:hypothetical protein